MRQPFFDCVKPVAISGNLLAGFRWMTEMVGPQFTPPCGPLIAPDRGAIDGGAIKLIKRVRSVWFHRDYACCNSGG